ncbi:peptidoglycan-binding protein [filamentous cyanobacterium LEGE 11480]|uniref:Peptidoglycan-binding protein n=1 Tax=Romeriopsis navalis LEGE 11480 TaxID=2777977 RepID=A0A928Z3N1_9CYAN|nr:peptidoglycan-binding protein [Romeriopsis navalis]MBE9029403.1 peptidoglycan-binding protein [Romeriopsis navalis LEGE 11480]
MNPNRTSRRIVAIVGCLGLSTVMWGGASRMVVAQGSAAVPGLIQSPLPARSLLQFGDNGAEVTQLQGILRLMGLYTDAIDGVFDAATQASVLRFQQLAGLEQDGIVGAATWVKLLPPAPGEAAVKVIVPAKTVAPVAAAKPVKPAPKPVAEVGEPVLRNGAEGPAVYKLQRRLSALGFYNGPIDGGFGDVTEAAVKAAQRNAGLDPDGVVGAATWRALR